MLRIVCTAKLVDLNIHKPHICIYHPLHVHGIETFSIALVLRSHGESCD